MLYGEIYEYLRKEKYGEQLQALPKDFIEQFSAYLKETKKRFSSFDESFSDDLLREKKQFENAHALFKELILRRKKKILNLVFVANETGIMKKDFNDMIGYERELFEDLLKSVEKGDKKLKEIMNGSNEIKTDNKMLFVKEDVEQFIDMNGESIGPFKFGELVNLNGQVAEILVSGGKARFVDS